MRRYYIAFGILLIVPIIPAAPVLVQERRQVGIDVAHIPENTITMLGNRGDDLDKLFVMYEDHFKEPEVSSVAHPPSSSLPSGPDHAPPSPESLTDYELVEGGAPGPLKPGSTMPDAEHDLVGGHAQPNPGPSTEYDHESMVMHAPLSSPVFTEWFLSDHGYMGPHALKPNLGFDPDHRLVAEEPPSGPSSPTAPDAGHWLPPPPPSPGSASPVESDDEMMDVPPSRSVPNPDRRSMGANSRLKRLQAVSDALKGNAKETHRISGTSRDVLSTAQRELQLKRSLNSV